MRPGNLGFCLLTHLTKDVDAAAASVARHGFEVVAAPADVVVGGQPRRIALVRGPNEELLELSN